jgi:hypothetical protein
MPADMGCVNIAREFELADYVWLREAKTEQWEDIDNVNISIVHRRA